jgi:hypothetical protein
MSILRPRQKQHGFDSNSSNAISTGAGKSVIAAALLRSPLEKQPVSILDFPSSEATA